ncbi:hypothetical protein D1AOALGA4SA_5197 [Olavius algarvensis Delta 1 endosymbiont]|nr:hypothetical protein D1AOALGA4SA_5197 [Olavius algarvensis Delta 1 endosymbiont]
MSATICYGQPAAFVDPDDDLIARGKEIFFNETFNGNGRTCGTCHRLDNNFTIDSEYIATLPADDPLFVAEYNPDLKQHLESPRLLRQFGLVLENANGFDDLSHHFVLRGVPHLLGLRFSVASDLGPLTGWSGDGAPGDGSLRAFAAGAIVQHFPRSLNRIPGMDFRLPTAAELDALAAYQLSLGRQAELQLPLALKNSTAGRGQEIFNDPARGKCFICHFNGGATGDPRIFGAKAGNLNFDTGVEDFVVRSKDLFDERVPPDDGFGAPGDGTFNTPSLIEAADTGPYFHNNAVATIESAVAFYNSDAFNNSAAGRSIQAETGSGIMLDAAQVVEVAAFLRIINTLENIRQSIRLLENIASIPTLAVKERYELLLQASAEIQDSTVVLQGGSLHPAAVRHLVEAKQLADKAREGLRFKDQQVRKALEMLQRARKELVLRRRPYPG